MRRRTRWERSSRPRRRCSGATWRAAWSAATRSQRLSRWSMRCRWRHPSIEVPRGLKRRVMRGVRAASSHPAARRASGRAGCLPGDSPARHSRVRSRSQSRSGGRRRDRASRRSSGSPRVIAGAASIGSPGSCPAAARGRSRRADRRSPATAAGGPHLRGVVEARQTARRRRPARSSASRLAGCGDIGVPGDLRGVTAVMVTQEPAGGSRVPTRAPVIVARLA